MSKSILRFQLFIISYLPGIFFFLSGDSYSQTDSAKAMNLFLQGEKYLNQSRLDSAKFCYEQAGNIFLQAGLKGKYFHTRFYLAYLYTMKGENKKADSLFRLSLHEAKKIFNLNEPVLSAGYQLYGRFRLQFSEFDTALYYFRFSQQGYAGNDCKNLKLRAHNYINIGNCWFMKERFDSALYYFNKCYEIRRQCYPPLHPEIASIINNLGLIYYKISDFDKAEELFSKALDLQIKSLGGNNLNVATSYLNLGNIHIQKSDWDAALFNYTESLNIRLKILGTKNTETIACMNNIANAYFQKEEIDKALEVNLKVLGYLKEIVGDNNPELAHSYINTGNCYVSKKKYSTANEYYKKGIILKTKAIGDSSAGMTLFYENIAESYRLMVQQAELNTKLTDSLINESLQFANRALAIKKLFFGTDNPSLATTLLLLSKIHYSNKDQDNAKKYLEQSFRILIRDADICNIIYGGGLPRLNPEKITSLPLLLKAFEIKAQIYEDLADISL